MTKSAETVPQRPRRVHTLTDREMRIIAQVLGMPPRELLATAQLVESGRLQQAR